LLIHTFAFRWKPGVTPSQKEHAVVIIRGLQGQVPGLLNTWVGTNISPRSQGYELGGVMQFSDRAALDAYTTHPAHREVLAFLRPLIEPIEVDFET
jgi:Stress responsive A/B Barrel Domain